MDALFQTFLSSVHLCRRLSAHAVELYNELVHAPNESISRILLYKRPLQPRETKTPTKPLAPLPGVDFQAMGDSPVRPSLLHMVQAQKAGRNGIKLSKFQMQRTSR